MTDKSKTESKEVIQQNVFFIHKRKLLFERFLCLLIK